MSIKEKVKKLIEVECIRLELEDFCKQEYTKRFNKQVSANGTWHYYKNFDIMSITEIRVNYAYGSGDYEFNGNFTINLTEFDRDSKIESII